MQEEHNTYLIYDTLENDCLLGEYKCSEACEFLNIQRGSLYKALSRNGMVHRRYYVLKVDDEE